MPWVRKRMQKMKCNGNDPALITKRKEKVSINPTPKRLSITTCTRKGYWRDSGCWSWIGDPTRWWIEKRIGESTITNRTPLSIQSVWSACSQCVESAESWYPVYWRSELSRYPKQCCSTLIQCVLRTARSAAFILFLAHSENLVQKVFDQASDKKFANFTRAETTIINAYKSAAPKSIGSRVIRAILVNAIPRGRFEKMKLYSRNDI